MSPGLARPTSVHETVGVLVRPDANRARLSGCGCGTWDLGTRRSRTPPPEGIGAPKDRESMPGEARSKLGRRWGTEIVFCGVGGVSSSWTGAAQGMKWPRASGEQLAIEASNNRVRHGTGLVASGEESDECRFKCQTSTPLRGILVVCGTAPGTSHYIEDLYSYPRPQQGADT